jgi:hypothetical protein
MKLGQKYYYIDQESLTVGLNVLLSHSIESHSKYGVCVFKTGTDANGEGKYAKVEDSLVFTKKGDAEIKLREVAPIITEANATGQELNKVMREAREKVIGKPQYDKVEV